MKILIVIPMQKELDFCVQGCIEQGYAPEPVQVGQMQVVHVSELDLVFAEGGLGKAQFAVQTQHLIDHGSDWEVVICAGAAGALSERVMVGDVVIGTETVEYDIQNKFGQPLLPHFEASTVIVDELAHPFLKSHHLFTVHVGKIASGDEDIVDVERREQVRTLTGALANGWEGAGGARASSFSGIPFVEVRGISDGANETAPQDFERNLPETMRNIACVIVTWAKVRQQQY